LLTSPSTTTIASVCNSDCAAWNESANSDASMRPERSSRVMKPILSPFLFFITRRRDDHPRNGLGITRRFQIDNALTGETANLAFIFINRVTGQVQAQGVFFTFETLLERQLLGLAMVRINVGIGFDEQAAEQVGMAAVMGARGLFGGLIASSIAASNTAAVAVDVGLVSCLLIVEVRAQAIQRAAANQPSRVRLLMRLRSTRAQKSNRSLNGPA
jgi:hypothetical protein